MRCRRPDSNGVFISEAPTGSLDETLVEQTIGPEVRSENDRQKRFALVAAILRVLYLLKDAQDAAQVALAAPLSSSDHSDIVTLNSREHVHAEEAEAEEASDEELYLGTPCSSQYTFTPADTGGSWCPCSTRRLQEKPPNASVKQLFSLCVFLRCQIRLDVDLEASSEPGRLRLPSETSAR